MNNILIISMITLVFASVAVYSKLFRNLVKSKKEIAKLLINNVVLEEYIKGIEDNKIQSDESIHKENFIKFLSDSRDWAYEYIETVQAGLNVFVDDVEPLIDYFDTYGDAGPIGPNYDALKKISVSFKELQTLLPEHEDE